MIIQREGQEQAEKRDIFELYIFYGSSRENHSKFLVGTSGVEAIGVAGGVVNIHFDSGDMHSIFIGQSDTVYTKHRKAVEQLIVVPDLMNPNAP